MTLDQMIAQARTELQAAIAARRSAQDALMALRQDPNLTEEAVAERTAARDAADQAVTARQARLDELVAEEAREAELAELSQRVTPAADRPTGGTRVTSEPEVYRKGGQTSYFKDLIRAQLSGSRDAIDRLVRNDRAMADSVEYRALTTTDGAGGDFVPPLWMVQNYIELARPGRVTADLVRNEQLPAGTDSINLPRLATGTAVAEQATQNTAVQNTDATTNSVTAAVATLAGQQVVAVQLIEQSPINMDQILLQDLAADYAVKTDVFVINNNAANKVGLLNVSGVNSVSLTVTTAIGLYAKVADAIQQIHTNRIMPPQAIVMHPRRWASLLAAVDSANRPLVVPSGNSPQNGMGTFGGVNSQGSVGSLQGLPVYVDPNIPTNLGAGTNEDRVIILRTDDVILFEGTPRSEAFRETNAANLSVLLRFYNYVAIHASRYPKSISVLSGVGLVPPTF
jgi:HK97 family phage major capsid protein